MKTKKIIYIGIAAVIGISFTSCKKYLDDVAVNPNSPEDVGPKVLLSNVEVATFASYTGNNARRAGIFTQHLAGALFQANDIHQYAVLETDVTDDWKTIYTGALVNAQIIIDKYGAANPYYSGIAKILKSLNLGIAADMWGDVPSSEALKGIELNLTPHFDAQANVYNNIQTLLSSAIADLQKPSAANSLFPDAEDFIFNGSTSNWIATAYVLKARYANRLSERSPGQSATDALSYLAQAYAEGFIGNGSDAQAKFGITTADANQWGVYNNERADYVKMGAFFVDTMTSSNDPRLPFYADSVTGGSYIGASLVSPSTSVSNTGSYCSGSSLPLVSFAEAKFIEAECKLRNADAAGAAIAHNEAVKASILAVTGASNTVYQTLYASETAVTISLGKIMTQKYIALFTQPETWVDWRRTDFPTLQPNPSSSLSGIPRRLPTSVDERTYNTNAIVNDNLLSHTWFDL